jgi:hypothetical protein
VDKINNLIRNDLIHNSNIFVIGQKEFEDTFPDEILAKALAKYMSDEIGFEVNVGVGEIQRIRNSEKFSRSLGDIFESRTYKNFSKPAFAQYLAIFAEKEDIDEKFIRLFELISD